MMALPLAISFNRHVTPKIAPFTSVFGVFCQEMRKYDIKMQFFPRKVWWEPKFVIPLHPLSGTNVPGAYEKRSLRRFT